MRDGSLKIVQYNVRKERVKTMVLLLESQEVQELDIIAIQEPWFNPRNSSTYNPATSQFHLFHWGKQETRVCWYVNKRLDIDSWEAEYSGGDCCSLKIRVKDGEAGDDRRDLWVHNIYNPSPRSPR